MLVEYNVRTGHKVFDRTESRTISQLQSFPAEKSPPMVYLTARRTSRCRNRRSKTLREYLLNKQGMIFGDNGGSQHFQQPVLCDDAAGCNRKSSRSRCPWTTSSTACRIRCRFLPYVGPSRRQRRLGLEGRRSLGLLLSSRRHRRRLDRRPLGCEARIYEACYQLGTNVIFYAHAEYSKWLTARQKK